MRRPLAVALALALALLAGCAAPEEAVPGSLAPAGGAVPGGSGTLAGAPAEANATLVSFGGTLATTTTWLNGTFAAQQSRFPLGMLTQGALMGDNPRATEIEVPQGAVLVTAEVNAEVGRGDVDLWFEFPEGETWSGRWDTPFGGYSRVEIRAVHLTAEPVRVVLMYDELDENAEIPYTLRVDVAQDPTVLLPGVAVALPLQPGDRIETELLDAGAETFLTIYDPADARLARVAAPAAGEAFALPADAEAGEYVVLTNFDGSPVRLRVADRAVEARPLLFSARVGEARPLDARSPTTFTWDETRAPVEIVLIVEGTAARSWGMSVAGPEGEILGIDAGDDLPFILFGWGEGSGVGAPGLVTGAYTATVTPNEPVAGATAFEIAFYYER